MIRRSASTSQRPAALVAVLVFVLSACSAATPVTVFTVSSQSMEPTLLPGDHIVIVKPGTSGGAIIRGSIVVFTQPQNFPCAGGTPGNKGEFVKRVIGLPHEVIWSVGNTVFIDGKPLREVGWFLSDRPEIGAFQIPKETIPPHHYFVIGDNRTDSCDSRAYGPILSSSIVGIVTTVIWRDGHATSRQV